MTPDSIAPAERLVLLICHIDLDRRRAAIDRRLRVRRSTCGSNTPFEMMVLRLVAIDRDALAAFLLVEQLRESPRPLAFQCATTAFWSSIWGLSDHFVEAAVAHRPPIISPHSPFLGDEEEEVDDVLGLADKTLAQQRDPASQRRPGRCLRWQLAPIMMQPAAINGAVAKPETRRRRAGRRSPTSRPERETAVRPCTEMRLRSFSRTRRLVASRRSPISHGLPGVA